MTSASLGPAESRTKDPPRGQSRFRRAGAVAAVLAVQAILTGSAVAADSVSVSLVPSFSQCTAGGAAHAPPLNVGACSPQRSSQVLTVGTPDANGYSATSEGRVSYTAVPGNPATPEDEADVRVDVDVTDLRCAATSLVCPGGRGSDYTGKVIAAALVRMTDRLNGASADQPGTATDTFLQVPIDCVATPDTGTGGRCTINTTADAVLPNLVREGAESNWQLFVVQLWDAGPNGQGVGPACVPSCGVEDGAAVMQQGVFIGGLDHDPSGDPTIAAAGDIACSPTDGSFNGGLGTADACRQMQTSDLLVGQGLAAVLPLGDNQYECGSVLTDLLASFDLSWGRVKPLLHPVPGNHEYNCSATAAGFFDYFGALAGDAGNGYYSFDVGTWHLIALNSNCSATGVGCAADSPQGTWLRDDLAAHQNRCTLAYWHHPLYSSGEYAPGIKSVAPLWQALQEAGADVVLSGHDHNYERYARQDASGNADPLGIREFVVGTGGKSHYPIGTPTANSEVQNDSTFGVLKLTLSPESYSWEFVPEAGATFTDTGTDTCV